MKYWVICRKDMLEKPPETLLVASKFSSYSEAVEKAKSLLKDEPTHVFYVLEAKTEIFIEKPCTVREL